jgi:hypothetical protein
MDRNVPLSLPFPLIASLITLLVGVLACAVELIVEEEQRDMELSLLRHSLSMLWDSRTRKKRKSKDAQDAFLAKYRYIEWDRDRAKQYLMDDYLASMPNFNDDGFKRIFRVSHQTYDLIRAKLCLVDPFFRDSYNARRWASISVDAKILIALKYVSYGTAINAFRDYFQMGEKPVGFTCPISSGAFYLVMIFGINTSKRCLPVMQNRKTG